ncbi:Na+/H+ antiporter NhaC [Ruminococcaceae bacterium OttesenSCG-928-A11]|nr:Na+/H+ antiporter NhaC [Ruminococcaceae bacterium OttesenSCG-928-A11]
MEPKKQAKPERPVKKLSLFAALIPILALVLVMGVAVLVYGADPHVPLFLCTIVAAIVGLAHGQKWKDLEQAMVDSVNSAMGPIIILILMGPLVAIWIISGTVPAMVYYGLKILNPTFFLVASCILCCIVSLASGSSWTTAATVGIALMGIGSGLGIPPAMTAGSIVSGAYFGDKMSPLSDTTNLAPAVTGVNIFDHIRHMVYTTAPALVLSLIIYLILGLNYSSDTMDAGVVQSMSDTLAANYNINLFLLIPPILVILMVVFRVPAIPGMIGGIVLGIIFYVLFQGGAAGGAKEAFGTVIDVLNYGSVTETGHELLDNLLTRGGIQGMMWTISLIFCALAYGGMVDKIGSLGTISSYLLRFAKSTGSLVLVTVVSCIFTNAITGDLYLSIMIPGRMYKDEFKKRGLSAKNLSRCLEDGGTMSSSMFPWNSCGAYMSSTLGVATFAYVPFTFVNLLTPIISIIYGYTGFTMAKMTDEEKAQAAKELAEAAEKSLEPA